MEEREYDHEYSKWDGQESKNFQRTCCHFGSTEKYSHSTTPAATRQ